MKRAFAVLLALSLALALRAQAPSGESYSPDQLDQLLGPIALYPDPLIALILPASTFPDQVASAAQFVSSNADRPRSTPSPGMRASRDWPIIPTC
jgi:hypothetical protein